VAGLALGADEQDVLPAGHHVLHQLLGAEEALDGLLTSMM
jgi:hypothetical protein